MKIWVDDIRPAPSGYRLVKSVNEAIRAIKCSEAIKDNVMESENKWGIEVSEWEIEVIDLDHDAGDYYKDGGDYIRILDWLEETGRNYPIHIHSMNPVGVANMRSIIQKNNWSEI